MVSNPSKLCAVVTTLCKDRITKGVHLGGIGCPSSTSQSRSSGNDSSTACCFRINCLCCSKCFKCSYIIIWSILIILKAECLSFCSSDSICKSGLLSRSCFCFITCERPIKEWEPRFYTETRRSQTYSKGFAFCYIYVRCICIVCFIRNEVCTAIDRSTTLIPALQLCNVCF